MSATALKPLIRHYREQNPKCKSAYVKMFRRFCLIPDVCINIILPVGPVLQLTARYVIDVPIEFFKRSMMTHVD